MAVRKFSVAAVFMTLFSIVLLPMLALADCPVLKATATPHHPCCPKPKPEVPLPPQCFAGCLATATEPVQLQAHMKLMALDDALPVSAMQNASRTTVESLSPIDALFHRRDLYILLHVLRR